MLANILLGGTLLPQFPTALDQHSHTATECLASSGDFPAHTLVAAAKHNGLPHILSDDMDLATFADITLYTANHRAITAASSAGKLR